LCGFGSRAGRYLSGKGAALRNGIDISGVSEIAHEIRADSRQAIMSYGASASFRQHGGMVCRTTPACIGSLKAPRLFEIPIYPNPAASSKNALTSMHASELALTGLAGCFLVSCVSGLSAKGVSLSHFEMRVEANLPLVDEDAPIEIDYNIDWEAEVAKDIIEEIVELVTQQSPNHRTFSEALPLKLRVGEEEQVRRAQISSPDGKVNGAKHAFSCRWRYGPQLESIWPTRDDGQKICLPIDQPKQLAGIDWGPNPQEYLLMGLAGDLLNGVFSRLGSTEANIKELTVRTSGFVDIRGMFDVADVPTHMQAICCEIEWTGSDHGFSKKNLMDALMFAADNSSVARMVRQAVNFNICVT